MASMMPGVGQVASRVQIAQGVAKVALSEAAAVCGQVEQKIQSYVLHTQASVLHTVREATQQLEKEVQAAASGVVIMSIQQTQALVGAMRGELQAQIEAGHHEVQKQQETIRGEMKKITDDVQLLTTQLSDAKLVNKDMLNAVEKRVKGEITKQI